MMTTHHRSPALHRTVWSANQTREMSLRLNPGHLTLKPPLTGLMFTRLQQDSSDFLHQAAAPDISCHVCLLGFFKKKKYQDFSDRRDCKIGCKTF